MLTMRVTTAEEERAFSAMNVVKNPVRSKFQQGILADLMIIIMGGVHLRRRTPADLCSIGFHLVEPGMWGTEDAARRTLPKVTFTRQQFTQFH